MTTDLVSDAEVAEVEFTAFAGRRKADHVTCRLIVRRVKRLKPLASDGTEQSELFATYSHPGFITNSTLTMIDAIPQRLRRQIRIPNHDRWIKG